VQLGIVLGMATRFQTVDRNTPMLLPPDLRDWIEEDDLVHFVIQAVERLPVEHFHVNHRGCGDAQYPPHMMLALLIYCYANGTFASRRIERATYRDVAVRFLTANTHPDHDTICTFRRRNLRAIAKAFVDILELAREMGFLKLGTVSLDGTHIKANASKDKNVTYERAREISQALRQDINELLDAAEQADVEDQDPQKLPRELDRRQKLLSKMDQACQMLEERAREGEKVERKEYERKLASRAERPPHKKGPPPSPPASGPRAKEQINLTDSESNLMRKSKREGYTQSYNAQAVVDAQGSQLIVGQRVSRSASDGGELEPDLESIPECLGEPTQVLADCGYADAAMFERLEARGIEPFVSVQREDAHYERCYEFRPKQVLRPIKKVKDPRRVAMREKLRTERGRETYRLRAQTVEPTFGIIKEAMGFRAFLLRGDEKVSGEWSLVSLAYNMKRLHRLVQASVGG
jgi:transposase